MVMQVYIHD